VSFDFQVNRQPISLPRRFALHFLCNSAKQFFHRKGGSARSSHRCLPSECWQGEAVALAWGIQFPCLEQDRFYRCGLPARTLAAHFVGTIPPSLCICTKLLVDFGNPCDVPCRSSGITRSPHNENKEERRKHDCYRYQKGNRGNVANH
jgi:hypothetical protein